MQNKSNNYASLASTGIVEKVLQLQRGLHYQTINNQLFPGQAWEIPGMFGNSPIYKTFQKYFAVVLRSSIFVAR